MTALTDNELQTEKVFQDIIERESDVESELKQRKFFPDIANITVYGGEVPTTKD